MTYAADVRACAMLVAVLAGCSSWIAAERGPQPPPPKPPLREVWVDGSALVDGVGTAESPFKGLFGALELEHARIHIRSGLYRGPFTLGKADVLQAEGAVVLYVDTGTVIEVAGSARLEGVTIQGGVVGIDSRADVSLSHVEVTGQRQVGMLIESGAVDIEDSLFHSAISETGGLVIQAGATVQIARTRFTGPFRRAIEARAPKQVRLDRCTFEDAVTAFWQAGGTAFLSTISVWGGRGAALFLASGDFEIRDVHIRGQEFALQARATRRLVVRGLTSMKAERAGIAVVQSVADLSDITVIQSGNYGAFQMVGGNVQLRDFRFHRPESYGVNARQGQLRLEDGVITDVTDAEGSLGDAVHLRQINATVRSVTVQRAAGAGVLVAEAASTQLRDLDLKDCRIAGIVADTLATVDAVSISVEGSRGPALAVPGDAHVRIDALRSMGNADGAAWGDCNQGASVVLTRVKQDDSRPARQPCVMYR